jgi:hypothetical protein
MFQACNCANASRRLVAQALKVGVLLGKGAVEVAVVNTEVG